MGMLCLKFWINPEQIFARIRRPGKFLEKFQEKSSENY